MTSWTVRIFSCDDPFVECVVNILLNFHDYGFLNTTMVVVCNDFNELKIIVRCTLVASIEALTVEELWKKVTFVFGGPHCVQLKLFGYDTVLDFLNSIPDILQLDDPECENSIVNLVSSELSRHMEILVSTNIIRPPSIKNKLSHTNLLIPYRIQCAFIRIFVELYPKGLSINDFVSNVLCIPIFKSFIHCAEILIFNLDHIFKRDCLEILCLQPTIINSLKEIIEEGKFNAMDIYNIDEDSLENAKDDQQIAIGLEYPFFNMLEETIKKNIEILLNEQPGWISEINICDLYIKKFGSSFSHYRRWGFCRVSQMFSKLPELCCVHFSINEVQISAKKHCCDAHQEKASIEEFNDLDSELVSISIKDKYEKEPVESDGILKKFLRNDPLLEASVNDCFLDQEIQDFNLQVNNSLDINVCRVNINYIPTIICQHFDESNELEKLLIDMKKFYNINESKFMFNSTITMVKHAYAFFFNDAWFRGIVMDVNFNIIKIFNIDDGSIHNITDDNIRLLHIQFSQLPAQAFTCSLHGIDTIDEDEFSVIVNKKCTIYIVAINQHTKSPSVKIKFMNSESYLNDEWIKNGVAEPESSSDDE